MSLLTLKPLMTVSSKKNNASSIRNVLNFLCSLLVIVMTFKR